MILDQDFYNRKTLKVAQDLLGCFLARKIGNSVFRAKIVETEAYNGPQDKASHASRGMTERNKVMFGSPGMIYVYFIYGMHNMFNIVTEREGYPAAVLIRAVELTHPLPLRGGDLMNLNGPAKLTKFLQINRELNQLPIYTKEYGLWVENRNKDLKPSQIKKIPRIGIDYAEEYRDKLWRFYIKGNKYISRK